MGILSRLLGRGAGDPLADRFTEQLVGILGGEFAGLRDQTRDLSPALAVALGNVNKVVSRFAAPVRLSPADWRSDPLVNALFGSMEDLMAFVAAQPDITASFSAGATRAYFLLTASRREQTVIGTVTDGQLRREVPQTVVTFYDHHCLAVCPEETITRAKLVDLGLDFMAGLVAEEIFERRRRRAELAQECQTLKGKLQLLSLTAKSLGVAFEASSELADKRATAEASLAAAETELAGLRTDDVVAEAVARACAILTTPEISLRMEPQAMILDEYGVKHEPEEGLGRPVAFADLVSRNGLRRAAVLADVERTLLRS